MPHNNKDTSSAENRSIPVVCSYYTLLIELTELHLILTSPALSTGDKTTVKITINHKIMCSCIKYECEIFISWIVLNLYMQQSNIS